VEQLEVENIVAATWMLRRAYRATTGDTRTGLDTVRRDWEQRRREHFEMLLPMAPLDHGAALRTSSLGCAHLLRLLDGVTGALATGQISQALDPVLQYFPAVAGAANSVRVEGDSGGPGPSLDEEVCRELAAVVVTERVALERARAEAERQEQAELSAEAARLALPGAGAAGRDLRYITAFRRDIARAHKMLVMLRQRPTAEPSDADVATGEGNGKANEPGDCA
jgi:hypothetical protein